MKLIANTSIYILDGRKDAMSRLVWPETLHWWWKGWQRLAGRELSKESSFLDPFNKEEGRDYTDRQLSR